MRAHTASIEVQKEFRSAHRLTTTSDDYDNLPVGTVISGTRFKPPETHVDPLMPLMLCRRGARIAFLREVNNPAETRKVLVEMVQQARSPD